MQAHTSPKPSVCGIAVKKQYGQHFLRDIPLLNMICEAVTLNDTTSLFEIGCGDGALTSTILQHPIKRLWVFEIDPEWATHVRTHYPDPRLTIFEENILTVPLHDYLAPHAPWTLVANLPYNITFPILRLLHNHRTLLYEAVVMVQHEVAVKLLKQGGRDYGPASLFYQHYFQIESLAVIPPSAFYPPPKVRSQLIHLVPRTDMPAIPQEELYWKFIGQCFAHPRRTLRNNLAGTMYEKLVTLNGDQERLLRAQEMSAEEFLALWQEHLSQYPAPAARSS